MIDTIETSYHEAGHVVLNWINLCAPHYASIVPDEMTVGRVSGQPWRRTIEINKSVGNEAGAQRVAWETAQVLVAGFVAQEIYDDEFGLEERELNGTDKEHCQECLSMAYGEEWQSAQKRAIKFVRRLLSTQAGRWALMIVADALEEHKELDSDRLVQVQVAAEKHLERLRAYKERWEAKL